MQEFDYKQIDTGVYCITGYTGDEENVRVPDHIGFDRVAVVSDGVFKDHKEIKSIVFDDNITDLGEFLFDGCENLSEIILPKKLETLWGYTFVRCGITEITLPDDLKSIPPFAFKDCKKLKRVICGKNLKTIHAWAFGGCDSFEEILNLEGVDISPLAFQEKVLNT